MCSCQNKISGMKRRKISGLSDMGSLLSDQLLPMTLGAAAGEVLDKQLTFLSANATTSELVKIGLGLGAAAFTGGFVSKMGIGLAINGATNLVLPALRQANIAALGLYPAGTPSYGVAYSTTNNYNRSARAA